MKALVCEMCSSHDLVKQDGMYVCQNCGTKYAPDEAKKLMIEIVQSKDLNALYERARQSLEVNDLESAAEYYKQILDEKPDDWEAYFYSYIGKNMSFTNAQAGTVAAKLGNTIPKAYDLVIAANDPAEISERFLLISRMTARRLSAIASTGAALLREYEGGNDLSPEGKHKNDMYLKMRPTAQNTISCCVQAFSSLIDRIDFLYKKGTIDQELRKSTLLPLLQARWEIADTSFSPSFTSREKLFHDDVIRGYLQQIQNLEPASKVICSGEEKELLTLKDIGAQLSINGRFHPIAFSKPKGDFVLTNYNIIFKAKKEKFSFTQPLEKLTGISSLPYVDFAFSDNRNVLLYTDVLTNEADVLAARIKKLLKV